MPVENNTSVSPEAGQGNQPAENPLEKRLDILSGAVGKLTRENEKLKQEVQALRQPAPQPQEVAAPAVSIKDPAVMAEFKRMQEEISAQKAKAERQRELSTTSKLESMFTQYGAMNPKTAAKMFVFENKEKIGFDEMDNPTFKISEAEAIPLADYVPMYFNTPQGKELLPGKVLPRGVRGGNTPKVFSIEEAIIDNKIAEEWQRADPEGYEAAKADYYSPAKIAARAKGKR